MGASHPVLHIDFETRSAADLLVVGTDAYAKHPTTDVWCMGWALDNEPVFVWASGEGADYPLDHVLAGWPVVAHNATFELAIWNHIMVPRYGWPELKTEQMLDTMVMAHAMSLPGSLEKAAAAVGLDSQKDMEGHRLMLKMCRPRTLEPLTWWDDEPRRQRLYEYCKGDIRTQRELLSRLVQLSDAEHRIWCLDQKINNRGVYIDRRAAEAALKVVTAEQIRLKREMSATTGGVVGSATQVAALTEWIESRGVPTGKLGKADVVELLARPDLPDDVRAALLIRQEAGKASTAKIETMLDGLSPDGRLRHTLQYHGAGTGRWAGRRLQPQNLPRPTIKAEESDEILDRLASLTPTAATQWLSLFFDRPMSVISSCIRGLITAAPGNDLAAVDLNAIEARGLAWLAGQEDVLDVFRSGQDIYCHQAEPIYGRKITREDEDERQVGKVAILALGYGGGIGAFGTMARGYGVDLAPVYGHLLSSFAGDELERAESAYIFYSKRAAAPLGREAGIAADVIKQRWRANNPRITDYWYALERAAVEAVQKPGTITSAGHSTRPVRFRKVGSFLWCRLPSKRALCYPYPEVKIEPTPWGEDKPTLQYHAIDDRTKKWSPTTTYGGKLAENVTQAVCRDFLAEAMLRVEAEGMEIVLHVHDELVIEGKAGSIDMARLRKLVSTPPPWAPDIPLAAKGWIGKRYRK